MTLKKPLDVAQCNHCGRRGDPFLQRFQMVQGCTYRIYCRRCGIVGKRAETPEGAKTAWHLHQFFPSPDDRP